VTNAHADLLLGLADMTEVLDPDEFDIRAFWLEKTEWKTCYPTIRRASAVASSDMPFGLGWL